MDTIENSSPQKAVFPFIILIVALFTVIIFFVIFFSAPKDFPNGVVINIQQGDTLKNVSLDLKQKHVIRSRVIFETFVILYGGEKHISEGDYLFENKMPVFMVARRIAQRDRHLAPIKVTIPEGFNNSDIGASFSAKMSRFNKDKFLLNAKDKQGFLFPDTYFFFSSDTEKDVINSMSDNFDKKIKGILPDINSSGKSENEIITMASIIEKEAKGDNDRAVISGILWNRINKKMPLQVDADMWTYKNKGLPVSPICNPGLEAIKASIRPVNSGYLYYLHDKNGVIHYAKTFAEHKINIKKYLK